MIEPAVVVQKIIIGTSNVALVTYIEREADSNGRHGWGTPKLSWAAG